MILLVLVVALSENISSLSMFANILNSALSSLGFGSLPASFAFSIEKESPSSFQHGAFVVTPGTASKTGESVSIFHFSKSKKSTVELDQARNFVSRLKLLRHPGALQFLDSAETDSGIFVATEQVFPFDASQCSPEARVLHISDLLEFLLFLHKDCGLCHGNFRPASLVLNSGGMVKVAGFFDSDNVKNAEHKFSSRDLPRVRNVPAGVVADVLDFASLAQQMLGGNYPEQWRTSSRDFQASRLDGEGYLMVLLRSSFVQQNRTVETIKFLRNVQLHRDAVDRLANLDISVFPKDIRKGPVVAALAKVLEVPSLAAASAGILTKVSEDFETSEFRNRLLPLLAKLAALADRGVRYNLLIGISSVMKLLDRKDFEKSMFVDLLSGFTDSHPVIREHTVRASLHMAKKLKPSTISSKLLPHLARLLADPEGLVRAASMEAVGGIATEIPELEGRVEILMQASIAGLKDSYSATRVAAVAAVEKALGNFSDQDVAASLLPALAPHLLDQEISVQTFDLITKLMEKFKASVEVARRARPVDKPVPVSRKATFPNPVQPAPANFQSPRVHAAVAAQPNRPAAAPVPSLNDLDADFWAELDKPSS